MIRMSRKEAIDRILKMRQKMNVCLIVGTGLTMAATEEKASWTGLLLDGAQRCQSFGTRKKSWVDRIRADLRTGHLG